MAYLVIKLARSSSCLKSLGVTIFCVFIRNFLSWPYQSYVSRNDSSFMLLEQDIHDGLGAAVKKKIKRIY